MVEQILDRALRRRQFRSIVSSNTTRVAGLATAGDDSSPAGEPPTEYVVIDENRARLAQEAPAMTKIHDLIKSENPTISYEFFPPKNDLGVAQFNQCLTDLTLTEPTFVSVTYGAAGSDRQRTRDVVVGIQQGEKFPAMAHLTSIGHTRSEISELMATYDAAGVENILALGGDAPVASASVKGEFAYASDLVEFLRDNHDLSIGVAAHPEGHPRSLSMVADRQALARKLEAADFAITQFFFDSRHYFSMIEDLAALGCDKPVIPGVIPITSAGQVKRFAEMAGAEIPSDLASQIEGANGDSGEVTKIGIERAVRLGRELLDGGAPGLHMYCLNRPEPTKSVLGQLGLLPRE